MVKSIKISNSEQLTKLKSSFSDIIVSLPIHKSDVVNPYSQIIQNKKTIKILTDMIRKLSDHLEDESYLFIYGSPTQLTEVYNVTPSYLRFRHWISIDVGNEIEQNTANRLKHNHIGLLMFYKGSKFLPLNTKNTRVPYVACSCCGRNVKDWGGKKHLMNTKGAGVSDVWKDFYKVKRAKKDPDNNLIKLKIIDSKDTLLDFGKDELPKVVKERLLNLIGYKDRNILIVNVNKTTLPTVVSKIRRSKKRNSVHKNNHKTIENKVILGDCISVMENLSEKYPEGVFDLVFADPPYNLDKNYTAYDEGHNIDDLFQAAKKKIRNERLKPSKKGGDGITQGDIDNLPKDLDEMEKLVDYFYTLELLKSKIGSHYTINDIQNDIFRYPDNKASVRIDWGSVLVDEVSNDDIVEILERLDKIYEMFNKVARILSYRRDKNE